ncbi:MAG: hypothetical protein J6A36_00670 [Clostridia bacterium]|nr:hypothetical protein [Clostridia bacterium]
MKNQKGITLVALVITIIVLLILAGVSISLVVGQNGVLGKATNSVMAQKAAATKEAVSLAINALETEYFTQWTGNQATTRASVYTVTNLSTELGTSYTVDAKDSKASLMGANELTITKGTDEVRLTFTIDNTGKITWTKVEVKDNGNFKVVSNV